MLARAGDACDLGGVGVLCPAPTRCVPVSTSTQGAVVARCTVPAREQEPNERAVTARTTVRDTGLLEGSLAIGDEEDCVTVRVPAGAALYAEATASLVARLYRSSGVEVGRWTLRATAWDGPLAGSARLEPSAIAALRGMAADDYALCVRAPADVALTRSGAPYALAVAVLPRSW